MRCRRRRTTSSSLIEVLRELLKDPAQVGLAQGLEAPIVEGLHRIELAAAKLAQHRGGRFDELPSWRRHAAQVGTLLRSMLRAGGRVRLDARDILQVTLEPLNTRARASVFQQFLADINARSPRTSGPGGHPI